MTAATTYLCDPKTYEPFENCYPFHSDVSGQWLEATHIVPVSALGWVTAKNWHIGPRVVPDSRWFCFPESGGTLELHDLNLSYRFKPKDLILVPKGVNHTISVDTKDPHTLQLSIHFQAYVYGSISVFDLIPFPFHIPFASDSPFVSCSSQLVRLYVLQVPGWNKIMSTRIFDVLMYIYLQHGDLFSDQHGSLGDQEVIRLLPALKLIEQRFNDPSLSVIELARSVSMSEPHFRRVFNKVIQMSPVLFVQRRRIEQACVQLKKTQLTIKEIAETNGFTDLPFFYRVFKNWIKTTPLEYRNHHEI